MIYFTGDTHGSRSVNKLSRRHWPEGEGLTRDDFVVICGDFGLVWYPEGEGGWKEDRYWLDWLEERPWTTLFVDGNHENHDLLDAMEPVEWRGGRVHEVRPHVLHLMRGEAFDLPVGDHAETLLAMGGARSHDTAYRKEGRDWWPRELPDGADFERCRATLDARGWKVDWVATHDVPGRFLTDLVNKDEEDYGARVAPDRLNAFLDELDARLEYRAWYSGHWHTDYTLGDGHCVLYYSIVPAGGTPEEHPPIKPAPSWLW